MAELLVQNDIVDDNDDNDYNDNKGSKPIMIMTTTYSAFYTRLGVRFIGPSTFRG